MEESSKLELFSAMDILQDLPECEVEALMNSTPIHTAEKGTEFYGPDGPEVLFLLKSGKVEMFRRSTDGKRLTLAIVEPGTVFGEMSLIGQRMVGTCATAIEDSVICALSRSPPQRAWLHNLLSGSRHGNSWGQPVRVCREVTDHQAAQRLRRMHPCLHEPLSEARFSRKLY